ncbi:MAG: ATP-binding protein, partial [Methanobacterium sp.]
MKKSDSYDINSNAKETNSNEFVFRPRARIMRTLGQELISDESVALIELVKNSFDADATRVLIRFTNPLKKGKGIIEVIDNGVGMSMNTIKNAWMEPATNSKRTRKTSEKLNRKLLGEKGIGRFACSRLASDLELITKRESDSLENYAYFDWEQFDNEEVYLDQIEVLAEQRLPKEICSGGSIEALDWNEELRTNEIVNHKQGTILRMNKLIKDWSEPEFKDLQRNLSRLISPFVQFSDFRIKLELPSEISQYSKEISSP